MKRTVSLLLAVVLLVGMIPAGSAAAQTQQAVTDPELVTFEDYQLSTSVEDLPGYVAHNGAVIKAAPDNAANQALYLSDGSEVPYYTHRFEQVKNYVLEFDAYIPSTNNTVSLQIPDGSAAGSKTSFVLAFNHLYGLRVYNGSWSVINADAKLTAAAWHKIRIEVTNDGVTATAKVSVNGSEVGSTNVVYTSNSFEYGMRIYMGNANQSCYIDNVKMTAEPHTSGNAGAASVATFDDVEPGTTFPDMFTTVNMATIKAGTGVNGTNGVHLKDEVSADIAQLRVTTANTNAFELEFDAKGAAGAVQMYITNGVRNTANTAFWIQFYGKNVQYYNGSAWVTMKTRDVYFNTWAKVRLEGDMQTVKVYVNDELMGEAKRAGGNYGTNVTDTINSVTFVCGGMSTTNDNCYVDNVKLAEQVTPAAVDESFDTVAAFASVETIPGYKAHNAAQIRVNPTNAEEKALYLCDSTDAAYPYLHCTVEPSHTLTTEFDLYTEESNMFGVKILSGNSANANTAFWLRLGANGLYSYDQDGYVEFSDVALKIGQWNKIRIEVTLGVDAAAKVYVDGEYAGTALQPDTTVIGSAVTTVDGVYLMSAQHKDKAFYVDNLKITSGASIPGIAVSGSKLTLKQDLALEELIVESGKTLDLNGYTLTVKDLACFGSMVDTSNGNTGKLIAENLELSDLTYAPVYDSANGYYRFFAFSWKNLGIRKTETDRITYGFQMCFTNPEAYKLMAAGESRVNLSMTLQWGTDSRTFALTPAFVQEYAALQATYPNAQVAVMLNVTGLSTLANGTKLSATPVAEVAGAVASGTALTYVNEDGRDTEGLPLLQTQMGDLFDIADNTEKEGLPTNNTIVEEDFSASGGVYGFTQIPNAVYDPDTGRVYVNYSRHRDVAVNYPYDSTRVYAVETLLGAKSGAQLQTKYVDMKTDNTTYFTAMAKLRDGRMFFQNYIAYYLTSTTATTYSWIVDKDGNWTKVTGKLTLPSSIASASGAQASTNWHRYGFSRCMIELDDGTLLGSMYGTNGAIMVESKDYGLTWTYRSTIAANSLGMTQTDGTAIKWFEPAVTRCADGSLLAVLRTWRDKPMWQARSYDNGLTWTKPTLMPGLEGKSIYPHLVLLSNGVLAMATGVPGDTIYFSLDGCGYNWDQKITTYSDNTTGNAAITELDYDAATGTVTLLALGDKGFNNLSKSGVWGRIVKVTRNNVSNPELASAVIRVDNTDLAPGDTVQARVDAVFNTNSDVIGQGYTVKWTSLTPTIASVDQTGKITAKAVGTAQIQSSITYDGKTVTSNKLTLEIHDKAVMDRIDVTVTPWVLAVGYRGSVTKKAYNTLGEEITDGSVTWSFESLNTALLSVNASSGSYRAVKSGVAEMRVTATCGSVKLTKTITIIVESNNWVTETFESTSIPTNCKVSNLVTLSTAVKHGGKQALYINDTSDTQAPSVRFEMPDSKGVIVEFWMRTESSAHAPAFGIGAPRADGFYNYSHNVAYIGLLYNALTGAQGFQAFNGSTYSYVNRNNVIPHNQWNKIRLEITVDKPGKLYVNDTYLVDLPVAADKDVLNTLFFTSGGAAYIGDAFYIDDIRYMVFN